MSSHTWYLPRGIYGNLSPNTTAGILCDHILESITHLASSNMGMHLQSCCWHSGPPEIGNRYYKLFQICFGIFQNVLLLCVPSKPLISLCFLTFWNIPEIFYSHTFNCEIEGKLWKVG